MANLPPNTFMNASNPQQNSNSGHTMVNHNQQNQIPLQHTVKQDPNSNIQNQVGHKNMNSNSGSNSPAFNRPPMPPTQGRPQMNSVPLHVSNQMPPQQRNMTNMNYGLPPQANYSQAQQHGQINANAPPLIPSSQPYYNPPHMNGASQMKPPSSSPHPVPNMPPSSMSNRPPSGPPSHFPPRASPSLPGPPKPNGPYMPAQHSSMNGPSMGVPPGPSIGLSGHPSSISGPSAGFGVPPRSIPSGPHPERVKAGPPSSIPGPIVPSSGVLGPPRSSAGPPSSFKAPTNSISGPTSLPPMDVSRSSMPQSGFKPQANYGPNSVSGPPSGPISFAGSSSNVSGPPSGPVSFTGPPCVAGPPSGPVSFAGPPNSVSGPPSGPISFTTPPSSVAGPPTGPISFTGPPSGPVSFTGPPTSFAGPPNSVPGPPTGPASFTGPPRGPVNLPGTAGNSGPQSGINAPPTGYPGPAPPATHHNFSPYPNNYVGPSGPPRANQPLPPVASRPPGPASGPVNSQAKGSSQNRYPPMPQKPVNLDDDVPPLDMTRYPDNAQGLAQQMGQLSVTKQGFDQLWGHQMIDLLQNRHIYPPYVEEMQPVKLTHQFAESPNCSPEIFRSTLNRIPETNNLLQKSRLPLGILIHPFKDLNHLPVIQCLSIVRCRACRTYINPFVYFVDSKRWKCNLCFRVNDLPDEFQYDPVTKSYGDPSRRPEIKSATIEYIAPSEYMLRPPQPAVYLFLLDVSQLARESGYLQVFCDTLKSNLDQLPGDLRTQVGFICYDAHVHYYLMSCEFNQPKEMTVIDIDDIFLPSPTSLLVNLNENRNLINDLLTSLPKKYSSPGSPGSALGAALQAAHKLMSPTGGRITVFQTCLPNIGPGALTSREDPNARSSKEVQHLTPATDFYKRLALDCSAAQVAVDLFLLNSQYSDLATLSGMSKFSAGSVYHIPLFNGARTWQSAQLNKMLTRYLTRKIGFEAVMRVRCTRGISIHTFHGNFFVRSTDLLSLPNVSPDAGFGMQLSIEETLSDLQQVCFQAALLYTSSKGERRIRVHTMALPIATTLTDVLHNADQECIIGLLSKMAVDRCVSTSMSEAREAVMTVAVDALSAHRLAQNLPAGSVSNALHAPYSLRLLPLYLLALLKRRAFRIGTSTRLDDRVADMCEMKTLPLPQLLRAVYPDLYPIHQLDQHLPTNDTEVAQEENVAPCPPRLQLTAERISMNGAYLLDDGDMMMIYVGSSCTPAYLSETFGVAAHSQLPQESRTLVKINTPGNVLLHTFIDKINEDRPYPANILVIKDTSPSRTLFTERLVEDRVESAFSYYEFLQHIKTQVK